MAQVKVKTVSDSIQMQSQSFDAGTFYVADDGGFAFDHPDGDRYILNSTLNRVNVNDLNDLTNTGTYYIRIHTGSDSYPATLNIPSNVSQSHLFLEVFNDGVTTLIQRASFPGTDDTRIMTRTRIKLHNDEFTWSNWKLVS